jgi:hypothetical protein
MESFDNSYDDSGFEPDVGGNEHQAGGAPDVGESLHQMEARLAAIESRQPAEDDGAGEDEFQYGVSAQDDEDLYGLEDDEGEDGYRDDDATGLDELISARVDQALAPHLIRQEESRREEQILALAEQFPRLREPEVLDAVDDRLQRLAAAYQDPSMLSDPGLIRDQYFAYEAQRRAAEETPADEHPQSAAKLETGAGPSGADAEPDLDPQTLSYLDAIAGPARDSVFTR